jgi:hypothetical protein
MIPNPIAATWADVALALITFAREDTGTFLLAVVFPLLLVAMGLGRFARFMGVQRIYQLADAYLRRLGGPSHETLTDDKQREREEHK